MAHTREITHYWQPDPDIASAVKGEGQVGGQQYLYVADPQARALLGEILLELKKINVQLATMTEDELTDKDIEGLDL